jgi:alkanesulfonate monooxygenase SsuD/methylene tetrahydromethanopterin reductase-like flavin-dependent oxidoreductase (luciferase family)
MDPHATHAEIREKQAFYRQTLAEHGHPTEGRVIPIARLLAVAETDAEAERVAREGASWTVGSYAKGPPPGSRAGAEVDPVQRYMDGVIIHGSPAKVVDQLRALAADMPMDYLMCAPLSHESFLLFTEKVLPKLTAEQ